MSKQPDDHDRIAAAIGWCRSVFLLRAASESFVSTSYEQQTWINPQLQEIGVISPRTFPCNLRKTRTRDLRVADESYNDCQVAGDPSIPAEVRGSPASLAMLIRSRPRAPARSAHQRAAIRHVPSGADCGGSAVVFCCVMSAYSHHDIAHRQRRLWKVVSALDTRWYWRDLEGGASAPYHLAPVRLPHISTLQCWCRREREGTHPMFGGHAR